MDLALRRLKAASVEREGPRPCVSELARDVDRPEPPDARVRQRVERVVGDEEAHCREVVVPARRQRDLSRSGIEPDELGAAADLHPAGPVPAAAGLDRRGGFIEVEQLVPPRSVAGSRVESPHARGDGRPFQPGADGGRATELRRAGRQRAATEQVDAFERRTCAHAVLVGHRQRDERQEPQRLLDVDLEDDFVASCDRLDLDRAEQAQGIEPPAILHERGVMEGHTLT